MMRVIRFFGSLPLAVCLLILIAVVLGWGTIYETRFGTAAVQRFIYQAWWFQALLAFLAMNLAVAALQRWPWKRRHLPFLLAHLGIILILLGGIIGGLFGIEGQLIIPEGQAERRLQLPANVLVVRESNPGVPHVFPTNFETTAWVHEPHRMLEVPLQDRTVTLVVDRYYPDAQVVEQVADNGAQDAPAVHLRLSQGEQQEEVWLFAKDPERFGLRWGDAHLLFLEPATDEQFAQLVGTTQPVEHPRGVVTVTFPDSGRTYPVTVPEQLDQSVPLGGTPYQLTFKAYFPDFALTEQGPASRSDQPNNPAVALTLSGPEGTDAHLLFAFHPDFPLLHGREHRTHAHLAYTHPAASVLPPQTIAVVRKPSGALLAVLVGEAGQRQQVESLETGKSYTHPWLDGTFEVTAYYPWAAVTQHFTNRSDAVRAEAIHVMVQSGDRTASAWLWLRGSAELDVGGHPLIVEYRPAQRELPFTVKLLDFRKIDYPGTEMAAGFESDVELTDPHRGIILMRKISMNNPLRYRGFSFFQSSYIAGPQETTILSVRSDPGTPLVYAGFLVVIGGVIAMFVLRSKIGSAVSRA